MRYVSPMSKIIAQRLHEVVLDGELGIDYTFAGDRAKNIAKILHFAENTK